MADPFVSTNPNPDTRTSAQEVFKRMYDIASRELANLGTAEAIDREAYRIAEEAKRHYEWSTTQKQPPDTPAQALRGAYTGTLGWVRQAAQKNGVSIVSTDEQLQAELDTIAQPSSIPPGTQAGAPAAVPGGDPTGGQGAVTRDDVKQATDVYRGNIQQGQDLYGELLKNPVNTPNARNVGRKIVGYQPKFGPDGKPVWKIDPATGKPLIDPNAPGAGPDGGLVQEMEPVYGDFQGVQQRNVTAAQQGAFTPVTAGSVTAGTVGARDVGATVAGAIDPLTAALQERTAVQGADVAGLQEIAAGRGPAALAAALRDRQAVQRMAQVAGGAAAQARGSERRGARALGLLQGGEAALQMHDQSQIRAQDAATAATTEIARIDQTTKNLQAQLDAARRANDQNAINTINAQLAQLKAQRDEFNARLVTETDTGNADRTLTADTTNVANRLTADRSNADRDLTAATTNQGAQTSRDQFNAGQTNTVAAQNADRGVTVDTTNIREERAGIEAGSAQDVAQTDLRIKIQKAREDSARGLLDEAQRQELIRQAREGLRIAQEQLKLAKDEASRKAKQDEINGWLALLQAATTIGTSVATSDVRAKERIEKIDRKELGKLTSAVSDSLSTWRYKKGEGLGSKEHAGVLAQSIEKTKLGKAAVSEGEGGRKQVNYAVLATLLAAAALERKKARS